MLHNFGKVYSMPHTRGRTDFQLTFIADRPTTSLLVITMAADDLKVVTRVSPGRIISAYIDSFEALSTTGVLVIVIQNTGTYTSIYNVCNLAIHMNGINVLDFDCVGLDIYPTLLSWHRPGSFQDTYH